MALSTQNLHCFVLQTLGLKQLLRTCLRKAANQKEAAGTDNDLIRETGNFSCTFDFGINSGSAQLHKIKALICFGRIVLKKMSTFS